MSTILRVWKEADTKGGQAIQINWTIWDRGDEMWELKGDVLRHFEVLERTCGSDNVITERLRLLRESAIPLEAIRHSIQGWQVEECAVKPSPQAKPVLPLTSSQLSTPAPSPRTNDHLSGGGQLAEQFARSGQPDGSSKKASLPSRNLLHAGTKLTETIAVGAASGAGAVSAAVGNVKSNQSNVKELPSKEKSHHEKPLQSAQETLEEESSQHFYNHPTELWSSLSQWIPPHALFQPSLHHQATLELSDTPAQTYPYQIDSSKNLRTGQGQHQHVRQGQHSRPYRPKPSLREIEIPKRPLFV